MALHLALLIAALLGIGGCVRGPSVATGDCAGCHRLRCRHESLGTCSGCHRGDPAARRVELAHARLLSGGAAAHGLPDSRALRHGHRLLDTLACRRCHVIGGRGTALATRLDRVVWRREQQALLEAIREPVENMPRFGLSITQAEALVAALLSLGDRAHGQDAYRVLFAEATSSRGVFERRCGPCHRLLTPNGPLGVGTAGPNLSGLFSPHYPRTAPGEAPWTATALEDWLRNPRRGRPATTMPPVPLDRAEWPRLLEQLGHPSSPAEPAPPSGTAASPGPPSPHYSSGSVARRGRPQPRRASAATSEETYCPYVDETRSEHARRRRGIARRSRSIGE